MKKKLALLLVLTMILSAIPMNVFGATQIVRGPVVVQASNTYADIRVDVYQLAQLGWAGYETNRIWDGSGNVGIPIEVALSDNGASLILDDTGGVPGRTAALTGDAIYNAIYATNLLQKHWDATNGSKRVVAIDEFTGANLGLTALGVNATSTTSAAVSSNDAAIAAKDAAVGALIGTEAEIIAGFFNKVKTTSAAVSAAQAYTTQWTMGTLYNSNRSIKFYVTLKNMDTGSTVVPSGLQENALTVTFSVPFYLKDKDAVEKSTLTVNVLHNTLGTQQLATGPAANFTYFSNLLVKTSNVAKFANTGFLDTLQVGEYKANYLNGDKDTSTALVVDPNAASKSAGLAGTSTNINYIEFRFDTPYARLVENTYKPVEFADYANSFHTGGDAADATQANYLVSKLWGQRSFSNANYPTVGGRYVDDYDLRITFNDRATTAGVAATAATAVNIVPDTLSIKNLMVAFDERMPYNTEVKLQYRTFDGTDVNKDGKIDTNDYSAWTNTAAAVVTRTDNNMELSLVEARGSDVNKEAPTKTAVSGRRDFQTEVVRLKETVPNSWNTGTTTFTVPAGVEIVGAHAAIYETSMSGSRTRKEGTVIYSDADGAFNQKANMTGNGATDENYVPVKRHQNIYNGASIEVNETTLTVRPMFDAITNTGLKREIEVQLKLSVEAGFATEVAETIDLEVSSSADLGGLESIPVALVRDPITATLAAEALELPTDPNFNVADYVIGDINIVETQPGDLRQSSELWLYVVGSSNLDMNLDADRNIVLNNEDTTFAMYPGVQLRHRYGNFYLNGLRYDVQKASSANGPTGKQAAADFSITNVALSGVLQPGADYNIVLSGSAVAENNYTVWTNSTGAIDTAWNENPANDDTGIFDSEPYELDAFAWDPGAYTGVETAPPTEDGETAGPVATISAPKVFNAYSYSFDVDANGNSRSYNNFYMAAASNGAGYAGISPRAFGDFVGGPDATTYDEATRTATITGLNQKTGEEVVVTLTLDATTATVNGVSTDIAAYNNVLDLYPVGSIKPFNPNGRMYVPIRFLCNAFEVEFAWDDLTKSVTLYPGA